MEIKIQCGKVSIGYGLHSHKDIDMGINQVEVSHIFRLEFLS